ncbi:hypothetical protein HDU67_010311 [Dinochytrium kinnereticum]|nr:hypothetical protein HDU67_010311 [Dinochytrium kinnereticum]
MLRLEITADDGALEGSVHLQSTVWDQFTSPIILHIHGEAFITTQGGTTPPKSVTFFEKSFPIAQTEDLYALVGREQGRFDFSIDFEPNVPTTLLRLDGGTTFNVSYKANASVSLEEKRLDSPSMEVTVTSIAKKSMEKDPHLMKTKTQLMLDRLRTVSMTLQVLPQVLVSGSDVIVQANVENDCPYELEDVCITLTQCVQADSPFLPKRQSLRTPVCRVQLGSIPPCDSRSWCIRYPLPACSPTISGLKGLTVEYEFEMTTIVSDVWIPISICSSPQVAGKCASGRLEPGAQYDYVDLGLIDDQGWEPTDDEEENPFDLTGKLLAARCLYVGADQTGEIGSLGALFYVDVSEGEEVIVKLTSNQPSSFRVSKDSLPTWSKGDRETASIYHHTGRQELEYALCHGPGRYYIRLYGDQAHYHLSARPQTKYPKATPRQSGPHWRRTSGSVIPPGAVKAGEDIDGEPLYVARAWMNGGLHLGKAARTFKSAHVAYDGKELEALGEYEVLCDLAELKWEAVGLDLKMPVNAFVGGMEDDGRLFYVGRGAAEKVKILDRRVAVTPGKCATHLGGCNVPFDGKEVKIRKFEVLVWEKPVKEVEARVVEVGDAVEVEGEEGDLPAERFIPPPPPADVSMWHVIKSVNKKYKSSKNKTLPATMQDLAARIWQKKAFLRIDLQSPHVTVTSPLQGVIHMDLPEDLELPSGLNLITKGEWQATLIMDTVVESPPQFSRNPHSRLNQPQSPSTKNRKVRKEFWSATHPISNSGIYKKGTHTFPFTFPIPSDKLPAPFTHVSPEKIVCSVSYGCVAVIPMGSFEWDVRSSHVGFVPIAPALDVREFPPMESSRRMGFLFGGEGEAATVTVRSPRSCYTSGDDLGYFLLFARNDSARQVGTRFLLVIL